MISSFINVILYNIILFLWYKQKRYNLGTIVIPMLYAITAILCMINYISEPKLWQLSILPFVYMFVVYMILLMPFRQIAPYEVNRVTIRNERLIEYIIYIYMFMAFYSTYITIADAVNAFQTGDWLAVRNEMYYGEEKDWNKFQKLCMNGSSMLHTLAEVWMFYVLSKICKNRKRISYIILLAVAVFLPNLVSAVANAARGLLFYMLLEAFIIGYIFKGHYSKKFVRTIFVFSIIIIFFSLLLSISITLSRFDDDSSSWLLLYFGHSMNTFNYGVMDSIHSYGDGRWFFGSYFDIFFPGRHLQIIDFDQSLGTHFNTGFITLIGCMYVDFGPIFTIIMAIIIAAVFARKKLRKETSFANLYLYAVYASFIAEGVFVEGKAYGMKLIIMVLIFYVINYKSYMRKKTVEVVI